MKMSGLAIITLVLCASCQEQTENKTDQLGLKKRLYEAAVELEDLRTAAVALNELILMDSGTHWYKDSLARIYIKSGNYTGAISLAEGLIESELADNKLKELIGVAYQQQKDYLKARDIFNELFAKTNDYRYLYQVAAIAYESRNKSEFEPLTQRILEDLKTDTAVANTLIEFGGPVSGVGQVVPIKAATLFLIGKYAQDHENNQTKAIIHYERAIGAYDKFEMPYYYLQEIEYKQKMRR